MATANLLYQIILVLLTCSDDAAGCGESVTIRTPSPMTALRGSCLSIPCTYRSLDDRDINPATPVIGIWFKSYPGYDRNGFSVSGDSSKSNPMNITGNLKNKDCTTMFHDVRQDHEDKYYFRVENSAYSATAECTHLQITVTDSAWSPSIEVSGELTETEVVTITCSAVTPCPHAPPQLTWDLHQGTVNITNPETNPDRTIMTKSKLNITLTDSNDGQMINCSAAYPVSGGFKMADSSITLSVTYGPKDTSVWVSPPGSLSAGQSVTLSCSSRANPPVHNFTWFTHSSQGPVSVSEGHTYNFNLTEDGDFYCVASNGIRNESSPVIGLTVTEGTIVGNILGAVTGVLAVILLAVSVRCFKSKCQSRKNEQPEELPQGEEAIHYGEIDFSKLNTTETSNHANTGLKEETVYSQVQVSQAEPTDEETIHYGQINFSALSPKVVPVKEVDETVYSEVHVSKSVNNGRQFSDGADNLYANVKN